MTGFWFSKKIPKGTIYAEIPLEACKAYPIRIFQGLDIRPRIAIADRNSRGDYTTLTLKLENGCKTARHTQIGAFIKGPYHTERIAYPRSNPYTWATWIEFYFDARELKKIIECLICLDLDLERESKSR